MTKPRLTVELEPGLYALVQEVARAEQVADLGMAARTLIISGLAVYSAAPYLAILEKAELTKEAAEEKRLKEELERRGNLRR